jgi:hypothetical protein
VGGFSFSDRFLRDLIRWEGTATPRETETLTKALAAIASDPRLPGRSLSHYDPRRPSFLFRAGPFLIHYRVTPAQDVEFLNLYRY